MNIRGENPCLIVYLILALLFLAAFVLRTSLRTIKGKRRVTGREYEQVLEYKKLYNYIKCLSMPEKLSEQDMRNSGYWSLGLALALLVFAIYLLVVFIIDQYQLYLGLS